MIAAKIAGHLLGKGAKLAMGIKEKNMAKNLKRSDGFDYIPPELRNNQAITGQGAYSNRSYNQGVEEAMLRKGASGDTYRGMQAGTAAQKLAAGSSATSKYINQARRVSAQGRRERAGREDRHIQANTAMAERKMENEQRFQDTKRALEGAAMQNIYGAVAGFGTSLANNSSMFSKKAPLEATTYKSGTGTFGGTDGYESSPGTGGMPITKPKWN